MNGIRLGSYQIMMNVGLTKNKDGNLSFPKSIAAGALAGSMGASIGSPFYMVKDFFVTVFFKNTMLFV